jgi:hypothetical protein
LIALPTPLPQDATSSETKENIFMYLFRSAQILNHVMCAVGYTRITPFLLADTSVLDRSKQDDVCRRRLQWNPLASSKWERRSCVTLCRWCFVPALLLITRPRVCPWNLVLLPFLSLWHDPVLVCYCYFNSIIIHGLARIVDNAMSLWKGRTYVVCNGAKHSLYMWSIGS